MGKTAKKQLRAYFFLVFLMLEVGYGVIACLAILNIRSVGEWTVAFRLDLLALAPVDFSLQSYGGRCRRQATASGLAA